jgi:hypothetical protein
MIRLALPAIALLSVAPAARAADTPDPLAYIPTSAKIAVKVESPRKLAEAFTTLDAVRQAGALAQVRTALESAQARRFFQVLGHIERELGAKWPELLDQLAGGGVAFGAGLEANTPLLLVIQGTDERQVAEAFGLLYRVLDEELTRQGAKQGLIRGTLGGADTVRVGDDLHAARLGAAVFMSNRADALKAGLDLAAAGKPDGGLAGKKSVRDAKSLLPKDPLAWLWLDFAAVKESKPAKDFFDTTRQDLIQTLAAGSTIDCLKRSDFVAAGLYRAPNGLRLAVRLPAGRGGFPPEFALHVPPKGEGGSLPLLEPPGVLYSQSFYLDIGYLWKNRDKLINDEVRKQIEEGEKQVSKILPGSAKLGELLEMWGPHHRIVVLNQDGLPYKTKPSERLPGFGYVTGMRDPRFGKSVDSILRAAGLIGSLQFGLRMAEEEHDGVKIVAYRFPEDRPFPDDPGNLRFNFEPCFAVVGDQFIAASSIEVCKKLIAEVRRTEKQAGSRAVWRACGYAAGAADGLAALPDPLVTEAVLREGVGIEEARGEVDALVSWLRTLGTVRIEIDEQDTEYQFDVVWEYKK